MHQIAAIGFQLLDEICAVYLCSRDSHLRVAFSFGWTSRVPAAPTIPPPSAGTSDLPPWNPSLQVAGFPGWTFTFCYEYKELQMPCLPDLG